MFQFSFQFDFFKSKLITVLPFIRPPLSLLDRFLIRSLFHLGKKNGILFSLPSLNRKREREREREIGRNINTKWRGFAWGEMSDGCLAGWIGFDR